MVILEGRLPGSNGHGYRPLRYRPYHTPEDTPEKVNYEFLTRVVDGLESAVGNWEPCGIQHGRRGRHETC